MNRNRISARKTPILLKLRVSHGKSRERTGSFLRKRESEMKNKNRDIDIISRQMIRLLPVQILLAEIACASGIISSLFASNYIGKNAMGVVGLFAPLSMLIGSVTFMLVTGSQILCGKSIGENQLSDMQNVFSMDIAAAGIISLIFTAFLLVAGFTALLIPFFGQNSVYYANILNGIVVTSVFIIFAVTRIRHLPRNAAELMVIPDSFGVQDKDRIDIAVSSMGDVVSISRKIRKFCLEKGIDERRAFFASLCLEEMAGNVVDHGFTKDKKSHSVDVRAVCKDGELILRIKDDCIPFDPAERRKIAVPDDPVKNIGIRMVYSIVKDVSHQNILGLNVLTMKV